MTDSPHIYKTRVRYAEVDKMGVVYHSRYIEWFEAARTEMLRQLGLPYSKLEKEGVSLPVVEVRCYYRKPVLYDDLVQIETQLTHLSRSKLQLAYRVQRHQDLTLLAEGYTVHCYIRSDGRAVRAPKELYQFLEKVLLKDDS